MAEKTRNQEREKEASAEHERQRRRRQEDREQNSTRQQRREEPHWRREQRRVYGYARPEGTAWYQDSTANMGARAEYDANASDEGYRSNRSSANEETLNRARTEAAHGW
jgi:hypothetical protein